MEANCSVSCIMSAWHFGRTSDWLAVRVVAPPVCFSSVDVLHPPKCSDRFHCSAATHGFRLLLMLTGSVDLCLQARWEARGLREGDPGDGCGEEDGSPRQPERQNLVHGHHR